jgi:hypothetical protein
MMTKTRTRAVGELAAKAGATAILTIGLALSFTPAQADIVMPGIYKFLDHPDAALTDPGPPAINYGLRLDDICNTAGGALCTTNSAAERTFSVQDDGASVTLDWTGDLTTASISGQVSRNSDDSLWDVSFTMTGITALSGTLGDGLDGWIAAGANISGMLMGTGANLGTTITLDGKDRGPGEGFIFDNDGDRCNGHGAPCAVDVISPRGWLVVDDIMPTDTNDWIVLAQKLPDQVSEPGTLAVLGLGILGLGYLRRRRSS